MSAMNDLLKVVHDESFSQDMYDLGEAAAAELADKDAELLALRERVEKMAVILQWIYDDGEGGAYRPDIVAALVAHNQSQ